jgi:lysophospholipid acyltransferase (LPLAT)-like uncharacterized protein
MSAKRSGPSLRDRIYVGVAGRLGPLLVLLLGATWRAEEIHYERVEAIHESGRPALFAFWHGVLLPLTYVCRRRRIQVLTSLHRDGEVISRVIEALGFGAVRGSSSRGSARALVAMMARGAEGLDIAVTPDGPRGPARSVKRGVFYLAEKSGARLVPVGVGASRVRRLSSWDGFMIPLPFSRVSVVYGEPLVWDESDAFETKSALFEAAIDRANAEAEEAARR